MSCSSGIGWEATAPIRHPQHMGTSGVALEKAKRQKKKKKKGMLLVLRTKGNAVSWFESWNRKNKK